MCLALDGIFDGPMSRKYQNGPHLIIDKQVLTNDRPVTDPSKRGSGKRESSIEGALITPPHLTSGSSGQSTSGSNGSSG
jgi:hypothetical protein